MMANWTRTDTRKFMVQMSVGALVGAGSCALILAFGKDVLPVDDPDGMIAAVTGLVYFIIALGLGIGLLAPRAGAHFLNVEDAEELREQRAMLTYATISMAISGAFLILLSAAERAMAGGVSALAIAGLAGACLLAAILVGVRATALYDELMRQLTAEASVLTLYAVMLIYGCWAALAHLGLVAWMSPLFLVSGFAIIQLFAAFWVVGRKGMLKPR